jgi:tetratricopeptide (TPR) repeat protein
MARIHVERREFDGALQVLDAARAGAASNPEFFAMRATVLQRLGRHAEAAEAYRAALGAAPENSATWAGLGVSLEALGKRPEAIEAFKRSQALAAPGSGLAGFAEQRLRALR